MHTLIPIILLAIIQGITEFLPVSSSGHLAIFSSYLEVPKEFRVTLSIVLHVGSLFSILVVFRREIISILFPISWKVWINIVLGTIPVGIVGLTLKSHLEHLSQFPAIVGSLLIVNGIILLYGLTRKSGEKTLHVMTPLDAIIIGICQCFAILPGISRSGSTISGGLVRGLKQEDSVTFSFMLGITAILGAAVLEARKLFTGSENSLPTPWFELSIGLIVSFLVGWISLVYLIRWLKSGKLHYFAYWCFAFGIFSIVVGSLKSSS